MLINVHTFYEYIQCFYNICVTVCILVVVVLISLIVCSYSSRGSCMHMHHVHWNVSAPVQVNHMYNSASFRIIAVSIAYSSA